MKIVVLGASGQIGSAIYRALKKNNGVIGTSRMGGNGLIAFDPFNHDWTALGKTDVLINSIGQIQSTADSSFYRIHVELTKQIISHRAMLGNPRIVQVSALGASSNHHVEFLKTKGIADELLLAHADTAVIRPSIVCTPGTMIVKKLILLSKMSHYLFRMLPVPKGFLATRIQPIMVHDLVKLVEQVCIQPYTRVVDAVGSEVYSFHEVLQTLKQSSKRRFKTVEIPKPITDLFIRNSFSRIFPNVINSQQYDLLFEDNIADVTDCVRLLGRCPGTTRLYFEHEFAAKLE